MRLVKFYYFIFLLSLSLGIVVNALTEQPLKVIAAERPERNATVLSSEGMVQSSDEPKPSDQLVEVVVESQGHENVGERKARQFGFPGFGYRPFYGGPYYGGPYYGGGFGGGYGGGFGGGFGGGGFGGGGFQRTRVVTRTRVVNRVRGGGFYGGGFYG